MSISQDSASAAAPPQVISLRDVAKRFVVRRDSSMKERIVTLGRAGRRHRQDFWALSDVNLAIGAGTTIGLIGHNGSGKSTLLKVIGGIIQPSSGTVQQRGRIAALIELGAGFHPDLTGRENVYLNASVLGLSRAETRDSFEDIVEFSGIGEFIDTQVKFYSSGMFVRLAFAIAIHTDPDVLLVDEVLAVGDEQFQRKCMDKIREFQAQGRTIIIVSHALDQVEELCDHVVLMDRGRVAYEGSPSVAVERFRELLEDSGVGKARPEATRHIAEVERIEVLDAGGTVTSHIDRGAPFGLRVHVSTERPLEGWAVGFSVDAANGQLAFASNTDVLGVTLPPLTGSRVVEVRIDETQLNPGTYVVNAIVSGRTETSSHSLVRGAEFVVRGESDSIGSFPARVRIS